MTNQHTVYRLPTTARTSSGSNTAVDRRLKTVDPQRGFSLIEIVLSIAFIGMIVLAINNVPNSIKLVAMYQKKALAENIAQAQVEKLRMTTYANLTDGTINMTDPRLAKLPLASGTAVVSACPVTICLNSEQTKKVVVTVSWNDQGIVQKVEMDTFISSGGIK
jgi:prepilin-type N-terminal cleavage/methylation domain-containing protein